MRPSLSLSARSRIEVLFLGRESSTIIAFFSTLDLPLGVIPCCLGVFEDTIAKGLAALDFGLRGVFGSAFGVVITLNIDFCLPGVFRDSFAFELIILF